MLAKSVAIDVNDSYFFVGKYLKFVTITNRLFPLKLSFSKFSVTVA